MPEQQQTKKRRRRRPRGGARAATLLLAYAALAMERADAALLPAVYREIGAGLRASPSALGSIALSRSVVQAACYPLAAYLAARHDRLTVVALGAFLWAAATLLIAVSTTFPQANGGDGGVERRRAGAADPGDIRLRRRFRRWHEQGRGVWVAHGGGKGRHGGWHFSWPPHGAHLVLGYSGLAPRLPPARCRRRRGRCVHPLVRRWQRRRGGGDCVDDDHRQAGAARAAGVREGGEGRAACAVVPGHGRAGAHGLVPLVGALLHGNVAGARGVLPRRDGGAHGAVQGRHLAGRPPRRQDGGRHGAAVQELRPHRPRPGQLRLGGAPRRRPPPRAPRRPTRRRQARRRAVRPGAHGVVESLVDERPDTGGDRAAAVEDERVRAGPDVRGRARVVRADGGRRPRRAPVRLRPGCAGGRRRRRGGAAQRGVPRECTVHRHRRPHGAVLPHLLVPVLHLPEGQGGGGAGGGGGAEGRRRSSARRRRGV
ncbi:Os09g0371400 [Oryza sativa Japonica Group]|uniref:Os09g0371400 protein n=1 Tax=Oryza sativa subsp. japonica TaxID=39947 RepID=A0A0P0XLD2_ORYSJ|nr:hypothetical protein EE612_047395 [Oryza sativa]BAT07773.1 Os09g0371400 [Oryza sativa Japonica Group]